MAVIFAGLAVSGSTRGWRFRAVTGAGYPF
jgi:hypothetical protein